MKYAIDCEMVGGANKSILARVSIVDENLRTVYDKLVRPNDTVYDYRTQYHGLASYDLEGGISFDQAQQGVKNIISGNILIGHSLNFDLGVLKLNHPSHLQRDVSEYPPFKKYNNGDKPSLKDLARILLRKNIQSGAHSSVEDARTCMELYQTVEHSWK